VRTITAIRLMKRWKKPSKMKTLNGQKYRQTRTKISSRSRVSSEERERTNQMNLKRTLKKKKSTSALWLTIIRITSTRRKT